MEGANVAGFALASPEPDGGMAIDADTIFSWSPSGHPGAVVGLLVVDAEGETFLTCFAEDDAGELVFPEAAVGEEFEGWLMAAGRVAFSVATQGDAVLLLAVTISHNYVPHDPEPVDGEPPMSLGF